MSIIIEYLSGIVGRCKVRQTYDDVGAGDAPVGVRSDRAVPKKSIHRANMLVYSKYSGQIAVRSKGSAKV